MTIETIIELQAKAGQRAELVKIVDEVITSMRQVPGFQGISRYEVLDDPDRLVEIAEWASPEARQMWLDQSTEAGVLKPLFEILGAPFKALNVRQLD